MRSAGALPSAEFASKAGEVEKVIETWIKAMRTQLDKHFPTTMSERDSWPSRLIRPTEPPPAKIKKTEGRTPGLKLLALYLHSIVCALQSMERVKGIEPSSQPWEGHILPLNHTRFR